MTTLEEYAKIKWEISLLEKRADEIKPEVLAEALKIDSELETQYGKLSIKYLKKIEYSEKVSVFEEKAKAKIKELQAKDVEEGTAIVTESPSLVFRVGK